jgi:enoyl-CoA hydratase/carnithine racemase
MSERVTIEVRDYVAEVSLNRPDKYNALDREMFEAIIEAGESLAGRTDVRAVVLRGEGGNFSAGIDTSTFTQPGSGGPGDGPGFAAQAMQPRGDTPANQFQSPAWVWKTLPVPVIAALEGVCFGGGLQIALGADIRYAAPDARLSVMEIKWGLIPDMGLTHTLRGIMPLDRLKELTFSGRIVDGRQAADLGLVTAVKTDPLAAARGLAAEIANRSPDAIRAGKRLLEEAFVGDGAEGLALEAKLQSGLMLQPNQIEAVMANVEKRVPRFRDPE